MTHIPEKRLPLGIDPFADSSLMDVFEISSSTESSPTSSCARGPLRVPIARFQSSTFNLNKEFERARSDEFSFRRGEMFTLAGRFWQRLGKRSKKAWCRRADHLNKLIPLGVFHKTPEGIENFVSVALESLTSENDAFRNCFVAALKRKPRREVSRLSISFGSEKIQLNTQSFFRTPISLLLQKVYFGHNFNKLTERELVFQKEKTVLIHVFSAKRLQEIFCCMGTCMVKSERNEAIYWACPKVFFKKTFGYVVDDDLVGQKLQVRTPDSKVVDLNNVYSRKSDFTYRFYDDTVKEFWPVRILIRNTKMSMTFSRVVFSVDGEGNMADVLVGLSS